MELVRLIIGSAFLLVGISVFCIEIYGIFRFGCALNRMHSAAMGDTLGIGSSMLGLMILSGLNFTTLKMAMVVMFLWFSSPVASHLLAKLELTTFDGLKDEADIYEDISDLQKELDEEKNQDEEV